MTTEPQIDVPVTDDDTADQTDVTADVLIEEVSIDGMCGVY